MLNLAEIVGSLPEESTWVQIPREYSMTARMMCNKPWMYGPAGFECEDPKYNCFTHYTDFEINSSSKARAIWP